MFPVLWHNNDICKGNDQKRDKMVLMTADHVSDGLNYTFTDIRQTSVM